LIGSKYYAENNLKYPEDYVRPRYVENDGDPEAKESFDLGMESMPEIVCYGVAVETLPDVEYRHAADLLTVMDKLVAALELFREVSAHYKEEA
jgi:hypothetical protein